MYMYDFIYCMKYFGDLGFISDIYVWIFIEDFESIDFNSYLKGCFVMILYGMLLDCREVVL